MREREQRCTCHVLKATQQDDLSNLLCQMGVPWLPSRRCLEMLLHMVLKCIGSEDGLQHLDPGKVLVFWRTCDIDTQAQRVATNTTPEFRARHNFCNVEDRLPQKFRDAVMQMDPGSACVAQVCVVPCSFAESAHQCCRKRLL